MTRQHSAGNARRPGPVTFLLLLAACSEPTAAPGPFVLEIVSGDSQVGEVGTPLPDPLVVRLVRDGTGVGGVEIVWKAEENGGRVSLVAGTSVTDANGYARVQRTLGDRVGWHRTAATMGKLPGAEVQFTSIAQVSGAMHIAEYPGDRRSGQTDTVEATLQPYRVLVTDHLGLPVANVAVLWSPDQAVTITDENGTAAHTVTLGTVPGVQFASAWVAGLIGSPVPFHAYVLHGNPKALQIAGGDNQMGITGQALRPYTVEVVDRLDNAIAEMQIDWSIASGNGSLNVRQSTTYPDTRVGVTRPSASVIHTLGEAEGMVTATAAAIDLPGSPQVTFTAEAVSALVDVLPAGDCAPWDYGPCDAAFLPAFVEIARGLTVAWVWYGSVCDVLFEDDSSPSASAPVRGNGTHKRTFTSPGEYRYRCTAHSSDFATGMVGVVRVR